MIIKKVVTMVLDVSNYIDLYTNRDDNILNILRDRYEGKCDKGCYIKSIDSIKEVGVGNVSQDGEPEFVTIPIICEITAIMYAVGETITGCKVNNRNADSGIIIASTDVASFSLAPNADSQSIVVGQLITVQVGSARYDLGESRIAVNAVLYVPNATHMIYTVPPSGFDRDLLDDVVERLGKESTTRDELVQSSAKGYDTFVQLLYPFKDVKTATPPGVKVATTKELIEAFTAGNHRPYAISRPPNSLCHTEEFWLWSDEAAVKALESEKISGRPAAIVRRDLPAAYSALVVLEAYCAQLRIIREMLEIYSTSELLVSHRNLWQIYKKAKV